MRFPAAEAVALHAGPIRFLMAVLVAPRLDSRPMHLTQREIR
jgi:hypothetical protein